MKILDTEHVLLVYTYHALCTYISYSSLAMLIWQRGATEPQNGYRFGILPGYVPHDGLVSSLASKCSATCKLFTAPELKTRPSRGPCVIGRGVNPAFHSQMSTPDHPLHQIACFFWCFCVLVISKHHCKD